MANTVERKFVVTTPDIWVLSNFFKLTIIHIIQTFLTNQNGDCHVRAETAQDGTTKYFYSRKGCDIKNGWRLILENREISKDEYDSLIQTRQHSKAAVIKKTRYVFEYREQIFNLDLLDDEIPNPNYHSGSRDVPEFLLPHTRSIVMIELPRPDEYLELPRHLSVIREITNDLSFTTKALAKALKLYQQ